MLDEWERTAASGALVVDIGSFTVTRSTIEAGEDSTLAWYVTDGVSLQLEPDAVDVTGTYADGGVVAEDRVQVHYR